MRRTNMVCSAALALFCAIVAGAQFPPKSVAVAHDIKPKLGTDFEAALRRHMGMAPPAEGYLDLFYLADP